MPRSFLKRLVLVGAPVLALAFTPFASADTYSGNGNSGFGGPIGLGSLALTDDGTTLSGTLTKGSNGLNDVLVIYLDSAPGGFADTSTLADSGDGLRKAISGFDGGTNRSTLTFPVGFAPDYALALSPAAENFGGLWQLAAGGANSLPFVSSANLNPTGTSGSATYTFSIDLSSIGAAPGSTVGLMGTYISNSGFRSDEFIAGNGTGTQGWNPFVGTTSSTYTVTPEPASMGLLGLVGLLGLRRKR